MARKVRRNDELRKVAAKAFKTLTALQPGLEVAALRTNDMEQAIQSLALATQILAERYVDDPLNDATPSISSKGLIEAIERFQVKNELSIVEADTASLLLIESTKLLLAMAATNQCEEDTPFEPMWQVRRHGRVIWTCGHDDPHESDA